MASKLTTALIIFANLFTLYLYVYTSSHLQNIEHQDFIAFYSAARLPASQIYDLQRQKTVQVQVLGEPYPAPSGVLPFVAPPVLIPLLKLTLTENFVESYWRWLSLLVLVCVGCGIMVYLITRDILAAVTAILFFPLFTSVLQGQASSFLTLSVLLWGYFLSKGKGWAAGLALGLLIAKPHFLIALGVPTMLVSRKAFISLASVGLLTCVIIVAFIGVNGVSQMIDVARLSISSNDYRISRTEQFNVLGLLLRAGVPITLAKVVSWSLFGLAVAVSCWVLRKSREFMRLGFVTVLAVVTAPHMHFHDLSLLLLPMAAVSLTLNKKALALFPGSPVLVFSRWPTYVLMTALGFILRPQKRADRGLD
jgi:Glycosyltransferase family 87